MTNSLLKLRSPAKQTRPAASPAVPSGPAAAPQLTEDLDRLRAEEQERVDRERQEAVARLQELARFD